MLAVTESGDVGDLIGTGFRRLTIAAEIHKPRMGFYWLRHSFQTVADGSKDAVAVSYLMGHADTSMAGVYREGIEDARLRAVTDHVHEWWFGAEGATVEPSKPTATGEEVPPVEKPMQPAKKPKPSRHE